MSLIERIGLRWIESKVGLILLGLVLFLPIYAPLGAQLEGSLFPVTSKIDIIDQRPDETGIRFRMAYTKLRDCQIIGVTAKDELAEVPFYPVVGDTSLITRGQGEVVTRVWHLDAMSVENIGLRFIHRCHPFWPTQTTVYP